MFLASPLGSPGPGTWRVVPEALPSGRQAIVALVLVAVLVIVLWIPVWGDRLTAYLSKHGPKVMPRMALAGIGVLLTGLVVKVTVLDIVGGCLVGIVLLAVFLDNY